MKDSKDMRSSRRAALIGLGGLGLSVLEACSSAGESSSSDGGGGGGGSPGAGGRAGSEGGHAGSHGGEGGRGEGGGGAPPSTFTPDLLLTFEGAAGDEVGAKSFPAGGGLYSTWAGGFGTRYSAERVRGGRATSAELSIKQGSDGDPAGGGTGTGMGLFGMSIDLPSSLVCFDGDTLHTGLWLHVPNGFSFATNTGVLKFFRWTSHPNGDSSQNSNGRLDNWILQGSDYYDPDSMPVGPYGTQTGWAMGNEYNHGAEPNAFPTKRVIPLDEWAYVEMMIKFSQDPAEHVRRIWVNDGLAAEFANTTAKYYDARGRLTMRTKPANETIEPGYGCPNFLLFTYWNGYAPKDQKLWVDAIAFHKNVATLPTTDELGNRLMGMSRVG